MNLKYVLDKTLKEDIIKHVKLELFVLLIEI